MTSWLLLLMTVGCAYVTYDAFRWRKDSKHAPFSSMAKLWRGSLSHLHLDKQAGVQRRYSSSTFGIGQICFVFLALTIILAVATVRAFLF